MPSILKNYFYLLYSNIIFCNISKIKKQMINLKKKKFFSNCDDNIYINIVQLWSENIIITWNRIEFEEWIQLNWIIIIHQSGVFDFGNIEKEHDSEKADIVEFAFCCAGQDLVSNVV